MSGFVKAVRSLRKLHAALDGPSGSGKSFTALRLAFSLVKAGLASKVAVIDTEHNSASLYAGEAPDGVPWDFDTLNLKSFGPDKFTEALTMAVREGYDAVVIDSLTHAWIGEGGALDIVDQKGGKFQAWKDVTPLHRKMVDAIIRSPANVIVTMRSKTEHVMEKDDKGNTTIRKVGMAPVQRDGMEYEFDLYGSIDWSHQIKVTKSRCPLMQDTTAVKPGPAFWQPLFDWLKSATPTATPEPVPDPEPVKVEPTSNPDIESKYADEIQQCQGEDTLAKVGAAIKSASDAKQIDDAARGRLGVKYKARLVSLKQPAGVGVNGKS